MSSPINRALLSNGALRPPKSSVTSSAATSSDVNKSEFNATNTKMQCFAGNEHCLLTSDNPLNLTTNKQSFEVIDLESSGENCYSNSQAEPLDLTVEKMNKKALNTNKFLGLNKSKIKSLLETPSITLERNNLTLYEFRSAFSNTLSNLFRTEFPLGLLPSNFQNYSAFLTAASAIYPYVLRLWLTNADNLHHKHPETLISSLKNMKKFSLQARNDNFYARKPSPSIDQGQHSKVDYDISK